MKTASQAHRTTAAIWFRFAPPKFLLHCVTQKLHIAAERYTALTIMYTETDYFNSRYENSLIWNLIFIFIYASIWIIPFSIFLFHDFNLQLISSLLIKENEVLYGSYLFIFANFSLSTLIVCSYFLISKYFLSRFERIRLKFICFYCSIHRCKNYFDLNKTENLNRTIWKIIVITSILLYPIFLSNVKIISSNGIKEIHFYKKNTFVEWNEIDKIVYELSFPFNERNNNYILKEEFMIYTPFKDIELFDTFDKFIYEKIYKTILIAKFYSKSKIVIIHPDDYDLKEMLSFKRQSKEMRVLQFLEKIEDYK